MQDMDPLTPAQQEIADKVSSLYKCHKNSYQYVTPERVNDIIDSLKRNCSPGNDGITGEHLKYGKSDSLCYHLSALYSAILSWSLVPCTSTMGLIVPVMKKQSLELNNACNYCPITMSSTQAKIIELLIIPMDNVSNSRFGYRAGRGTSLACDLLSDVARCFKDSGSPVYLCSLYAEKCFDNLWHNALLYNLWGVLSIPNWLLLYRWYESNLFYQTR